MVWTADDFFALEREFPDRLRLPRTLPQDHQLIFPIPRLKNPICVLSHIQFGLRRSGSFGSDATRILGCRCGAGLSTRWPFNQLVRSSANQASPVLLAAKLKSPKPSVLTGAAKATGVLFIKRVQLGHKRTVQMTHDFQVGEPKWEAL